MWVSIQWWLWCWGFLCDIFAGHFYFFSWQMLMPRFMLVLCFTEVSYLIVLIIVDLPFGSWFTPQLTVNLDPFWGGYPHYCWLFISLQTFWHLQLLTDGHLFSCSCMLICLSGILLFDYLLPFVVVIGSHSIAQSSLTPTIINFVL